MCFLRNKIKFYYNEYQIILSGSITKCLGIKQHTYFTACSPPKKNAQVISMLVRINLK